MSSPQRRRDAELRRALERRRADGLHRRRVALDSPAGVEARVDGRDYLNFCGNDYLGLANAPELADAARRAIADAGIGAGASHLVCGHHRWHAELEAALAEFTGRPAALLFSSGYMANLATITALTGRGDHVLCDRLNHASLLDAGRLSGARWRRFRHADVDHLARLLDRIAARRRAPSRVLIAVDGVFSMDGDLAPLPELAELAQAHDAWLMVDEAHGIGVCGPEGRGAAAHYRLAAERVPVLMGTLGKALGVAGAFVAGSEELVDTLVQFGRPYIYTTAQPPALAAAALSALSLLRAEPQRRSALRERIAQFRRGAAALNLPLARSNTAIQPLVLGSAERALSLAAHCAERGVLVAAIRPPTVPAGSARLRVTLSAAHSAAQVERLLSVLADSPLRGP